MIELPWLVAREKLDAEYADALSLLATCEEPFFPALRFRLHGAWALILAALDRSTEAATHAHLAVAAAHATDSGLRSQGDVGLVSAADRDQLKELQRIGGAADQGDES